jgi:hypothetical protein
VLRLLALTTVYDCVGAPCSGNSSDPKFYISLKEDNGEYIKDSNGLMEAYRCSVSFMLVTRKAIEEMIRCYPDMYYFLEEDGNPTKEKRYSLFNPELINNRAWGEDMAFCNRWLDIGGKIMVDPFIKIKRHGTAIYEHDYLKALEEKNEQRELLSAR